jgi:hypothetical protein
VDLTQVLALVQERGDLQLVPPSALKLDLKHKALESPPAPSASAPRELSREVTAKPASSGRPISPLQRAAELRKASAKIQRKPSWWTARATAGEVTAGFTKAEILKQAPEDPRAPDGVLSKVTELLEELRS